MELIILYLLQINYAKRRINKEDTMKIKLEQIAAAVTAIRMIDLTANPGKESMRLSEKFCEPLFVLIERYEIQQRKLVMKYGEKNSKGGFSVKPGTENWEKFNKDFEELLKEEFDLEIELLNRELVERANLTPAEVRALRIFTKQEETKKEGDKK